MVDPVDLTRQNQYAPHFPRPSTFITMTMGKSIISVVVFKLLIFRIAKLEAH